MILSGRRPRVDRDKVIVVGSVTILAAAAITVLAWWPTPGGHHHGTGFSGMPAYLAMWLVMVVAMMVPSTVPMALALHRLGRGAVGCTIVLGWAAVGYLAAWAVAGMVAETVNTVGRGVIDTATGTGSMTSGMPMAPDPQAEALARSAGGIVILLAGVVALTPLTSRCLHACRSPVGFIARHWTGAGDRWRQSLRIGAAYGVSCIGCCAALMVVLVVVGMQNLAVMLALAAVMAWQKHARSGKAVARVAALAMIVGGGILALS